MLLLLLLLLLLLPTLLRLCSLRSPALAGVLISADKGGREGSIGSRRPEAAQYSS